MNQKTTKLSTQAANPQEHATSSVSAGKKKSKTNFFVLIFIYGFSAAMLHSFVKSMIDFRRDAAKHNVYVRELKDLWYVLISAVLCVLLRKAFDYFFKQGIVDRVMAQGLTDTEFRIEKSLKQAKDIIYYGTVSVSV